MNTIIGQISNFYKENIGDQETFVVNGKQMVKINPSRLDFIKGISASLLILIDKSARAIFSLIGTVFTCGLNKNFRDSLLKNVKEGMLSAATLSLSLVGILFPQTIKEKVLGLPHDGIFPASDLLTNPR